MILSRCKQASAGRRRPRCPSLRTSIFGALSLHAQNDRMIFPSTKFIAWSIFDTHLATI